jgi:P-type conjugative transfer ATPase TrbB
LTVNEHNPIVEGGFPLDGSRFEGTFPPIVGPGPSFSLRKKASRVFTLAEYLDAGSITAEVVTIIRAAVQQRKNIVVVGGTSSGKTTFVNAVIDAIADLTPSHRLIILEDTAELQSKNENTVFFHTSILAHVDMRILAKVSMRYDPKRILVGEVRDAAALEMLKLWNTGHPGGVSTFHADSAEEALPRLEELVEEAGLGPKQKLIGRAVDLVVYMVIKPYACSGLALCKWLSMTNLISACRETPKREASLSIAFTIQGGKSTLTRCNSRPGRRADFQSTNSEISSPASKRRSNSSSDISVFFILLYLVIPRTAYRNDAHRFAAICDDCRPVERTNQANKQITLLAWTQNKRFQPFLVIPKRLGFLKINAVLDFVALALGRIILKFHIQTV